MKNFINEFREFASRGNALDMAVGIILGGAFTTIVTSLVNDIILPLISAITFKVDLASLTLDITKYDKSVVSIHYGSFIQTVIDFIVVAFCVFIMVKLFNQIKKQRAIEKNAKEALKVSDETKALREIIELLKEKQ